MPLRSDIGRCLLLSLIILATIGTGQASDGASDAPIIASVEIINENVFDTDVKANDNFLFRLANNLHIVTRKSVIKRELLLDVGDRYDTSLANESVRNLRGKDFLFKTEILLDTASSDQTIMVVRTSDKWTTTGGLSIHRSGGRTDLQFGVKESNFLGYGVFMSHDYFIPEDDRSFYQGEIRDSRLQGLNLSGQVLYSDSPQNGLFTAILSKPFYTLIQPIAWSLSYFHTKRRLDYYNSDGEVFARDRIKSKGGELAALLKTGPSHLKFYYGMNVSYRDARADNRIFNSADSAISDFVPVPPTDSLVTMVGASFRLQEINFNAFTRLNRFEKPEDYDLGFDIGLGAAIGLTRGKPSFQAITYTPVYRMRLGNGLLIVGLDGQVWFSEGKTLRRFFHGFGRAYLRYHPNFTFVINASFVSDLLPTQSTQLYLDEDTGIRGVKAYQQSGEERLIINLENRFFSDLEILTIGIGGVVFADIGNIWSRSESFDLDQTLISLGAGLRFGISRSTQAEVIRLDAAYTPKLQDWQISAGTRQYF